MKTSRHHLLRCAAVGTLALPALGLAHTGVDAGAHHDALAAFWAGFVHPLTGPDHLAAMFALGLWSALTARRVWLAPLAFALMLLAGATLGRIGVPLPAVEPAIAASVLVLGLLVALRWRLPGWGAVLMAGTFALFHGHAHGLELSGPAQGFALLGLLIATVGLHLGGIAVGRELPARAPWLPRLAGAALALFGAVLLGAFA